MTTQKLGDRWAGFKYDVGQFRFYQRSITKPKIIRIAKPKKYQPLIDIANEGSAWINVRGCMYANQAPMKAYIKKGYVKVHSNDLTTPAIVTLTALGYDILDKDGRTS